MRHEHLQLFVRIAMLSNISRAGKELGLSPAAASAQIHKLEQDLGTRLFHRTTRQVSLTEDGEAFLPHAEAVLATADAARASVGGAGSSPSGTLRISAPASFGRMHLMPAMPGFLSAYPRLRVDCRFSDSIVDLVEGGFDLAIRNAVLTSSSLVARKLSPDRRILCASPKYLAQFGEPGTPSDLVSHQCLILAGWDRWVFESEQGLVEIKVQGRFKTDNGEALRDACVGGIGISINSIWSAYQHLEDGSLVHILKNHAVVSDAAIWAVYPSARQVPPKVKVLVDYLAESFSNRPSWRERPHA